MTQPGPTLDLVRGTLEFGLVGIVAALVGSLAAAALTAAGHQVAPA